MIIISHRGNTNGPSEYENSPLLIEQAIMQGFQVEIDLRMKGNKLFLGHDIPQYPITLEYLEERSDLLWIHCKDKESLQYLSNLHNSKELNYFYHTDEDYVLTSKGIIWVYPAQRLLTGSVYVMPENDDTRQPYGICYGICTDYPHRYRDQILL